MITLDMRDCWINGRTLQKALVQTGANHELGRFGRTDRVSVNPERDAYLLGAEFQRPFPFCTGQGVMATVLDLSEPVLVVYELGRFRCTPSAFESALHWIRAEDDEKEPKTDDMETFGQKVFAGAWRDQSLEFSRQVCRWGAGTRVWGNLNRHYAPDALAQELRQWFACVPQVSEATEAIAPGLAIKGLSVSFASKHLRLLNPGRYAVLDEVLSEGLGYALNLAGYALFMDALQAFKNKYGLPYTLAHIEWALFALVRQSVRGQPIPVLTALKKR